MNADILIFSIEGEQSTNIVIDWLYYFKKSFVRINNEEQNVYLKKINDSEIIFQKQNSLINLKKFKSVWYRKQGFRASHLLLNKQDFKNTPLANESIKLNKILDKEEQTIRDFIYYKLLSNSECNFLGNPLKGSVNKLIVQDYAKLCGLLVADFNIVTDKIEFDKINNEKITKPVSDGVYVTNYDNDKPMFISYTENLDKKLLYNRFAASLLQEKIEKKFEIRTFYLAGKFYSTAIFTQKNKKTLIDSRRSSGKGIRFSPYNLPIEIEKKIVKLLELLDLNQGAVDLILDKNDNYIFLEVNPVGQFTAYGEVCNYYIEREIAKIL